MESNLEEVSVGHIGGFCGVESEVAELCGAAECAGDAGSAGAHGISVAGQRVDFAESREISSEVDGGVGDWDLVAEVVLGKGEVSDEVGGGVSFAIVAADNGDGSGELIGIERACGVVEVTVVIEVLSPVDEDLNLGIFGADSIEGGEFVGTSPEGSGDGDEPGVKTSTVGDGAGGVDWGVTSGSGDEGTASVGGILSWPVGVVGGNKGGKSGGDLHI